MEQERQKFIFRCEDRHLRVLAAILQAMVREVDLQKGDRLAVAQVCDHIQLDPVAVRPVVGDKEVVRRSAARGNRCELLARQDGLGPAEVLGSQQDIDFKSLTGSRSLRQAAEDAKADARLFEGLENVEPGQASSSDWLGRRNPRAIHPEELRSVCATPRLGLRRDHCYICSLKILFGGWPVS